MKKLTKKIMALILTLTLGLSLICFTGCNDSGSTDTVLNIKAAKLGYGLDWLYKLAEAYEKKTGTEVNISQVVGLTGTSSLKTELESKSSDTDLFFSKFTSFSKYAYEGSVVAKGNTYDCLLADITDVWNSVVDEGSSATIKDKMDSEYTDYYNIEGKYYGLPWAGGVFGIVRNNNVWNNLGLTDDDIPLTTDQLFALCDKVKTTVAPFIFSLEDNYYDGFAPIFMAQYEGKTAYTAFKNGYDPEGNISEYIYTYDGALEAMKVMEKLVKKSNGYQFTRSESIDFTEMQGLFLKDNALFCINGTWLENEMRANNSTANVDYIRTPVISSIIERLDTVENDDELSEVIKYIDEKDSGNDVNKPSKYSDADIAIVEEARHYSYVCGGVDHQACIPAYSSKVETAKDFLKFMYSDEGLEIYYKALNGAKLPANETKEFESIEISSFIKSSNVATEKGYVLNRDSNAKYFVLSGIYTTFNNGGGAITNMYSSSKTAEDIIAMNNKEISSQWTLIKQQLGL